MDNEFAEFEDMEVEDMSDQDVTLKPNREAIKAIGDKSIATVISFLICLFKLSLSLTEKFYYLGLL